MSDKYDKDDFSWLRGNGGDNDDQPGDDDFPDLDWLSDTDADPKAARDEKRLGVTGQLSWLQDTSSAEDAGTQSDDDDSFDWLRTGDSTTPASGSTSARLGVTGQLSWLGGQDDPTSTDADEAETTSPVSGQMDWLKSNFEEQLEAAERAAGVDWGTADVDDAEAETDTDFAFDDETESAAAAATADDDLPEWLRGSGFDDVDLEDEPEAEAFDFAAPPSRPAAQSQAADLDLPSWMQDTEFDDEFVSDEVDEESDSGIVPPAWIVDVPEDVNETPSWLSGVVRSAEISEEDLETEDGLANLFGDDLFADLETDAPAPSAYTPTAQAETGDDFDLLSELTSSGTGGSTGFTDLLNPDNAPVSAAYTDAEDDFDLLGALETPADDDGDDLFADMFEATTPSRTAAPAVAAKANLFDDDMDWLRDFAPETASVTSSSPSRTPTSDFEDVDDFLASLEPATLDFDEELEDLSEDVEFDDLFANPSLAPASPTQPDAPDSFRPDWLSNVSIREVSAAALVRRQQDRPVDDLSERLQLLREEGMTIPASSATPAPAASREVTELIPDMSDSLPPAMLEIGSTKGIVDELVLTSDQTRKVGILKTLTSASAAAAAALQADGTMTSAAARPRPRLQLKLDRLLISLLIAAVVALPFFGIARVGELPPSSFAPDSTEQNAFDRINSLPQGSLVLFAAEYGGTSAGELDLYTDALLRHIVLRGAVPVIVSGNPVGLLRADNRARAIVGGKLVRNRDYVVGRYLVGANIGMRAFVQDINGLTRLDAQGRTTGLDVNTLDEFALIVVVVESAEGIRLWTEQVAPMTTSPILFASSYGASPLAAPFAQAAGSDGLLIGYADAYTYSALVDALALTGVPVILPAEATETPTSVPTTVPTEAAPDQTTTTEAQADETAEVLMTETAQATSTPQPTEADATAATAETTAPTNTDAPAATATPPAATPLSTETPAPTNTIAPSPSATTSASGEVFGVVSAGQAVNVRQGPGRDFPVVGVLQPGDRVPVLGANDDLTWYNIRLEDGTEGWISAALMELEGELPQANVLQASALQALAALRVGWVAPMGIGFAVGVPRVGQATDETTPPDDTATDDAEDTPDTTPTRRATAAPTPTPTSAAITAADFASTVPYQQERWYGMTLGIVVIILMIAVGNLFSVIRRIPARRQRGAQPVQQPIDSTDQQGGR